jgi:hypothetical protein
MAVHTTATHKNTSFGLYIIKLLLILKLREWMRSLEIEHKSEEINYLKIFVIPVVELLLLPVELSLQSSKYLLI